MVDARLKDGSRVNAVIPPMALNGPCITIRKFSKDPFTVDNLVGFNTISRSIAKFLKVCVENRKNVVISGGTGSGKTIVAGYSIPWSAQISFLSMERPAFDLSKMLYDAPK